MDEGKQEIHNRELVQGQVPFNYGTVNINIGSPGTNTQRPSTPEYVWNIPYRRNPYFTGREDILKQLHDHLTYAQTAALTQSQAITGLGGIGKTQITVEYAYRHSNQYHYILWINSVTLDTIISSFLELATLLNLPLKEEQDQSRVVAMVKGWLTTHEQWLAIYDNADDLSLVEKYLPNTDTGHLLLTTRDQALGTLANSFDVTEMDKREGTMFLLRRAKLLAVNASLDQASSEDRNQAENIVELMDGLPLALDQAGAYIEARQCSLSAYLSLYQKQKVELLKLRDSSRVPSPHPESVTTTFSLSFKRIQQTNAAAADLLQLFAFFHSDNIPEEIFAERTVNLGPALESIIADELALDNTLNELFRYSLVRRDAHNKTLSIHRLVQAVLVNEMKQEEQCTWAERVVRVIKNTFPDPRSKEWSRCPCYLPHLRTCASLISQWDMEFKEARTLLNNAGAYLDDLAQYPEARLLLKQAKAILEKQLESDKDGTDVPKLLELSVFLYNLGRLDLQEDKYEQAEQLFLEALEIQERLSGPESPNVIGILTGLANLNHRRIKFDEAESFYQQAITIARKKGRAEDQNLAAILNGLAYLYKDQGRYYEADELYEQSQAIMEREIGQDNPLIVLFLVNRARSYLEQKRYEQSEPLLKQAIEISEKTWGTEHPNVASACNHLGDLYRRQGKYEQAAEYLLRALKIEEKIWGPDNLRANNSLNHLGLLYQSQGKYVEAEQLLQRALRIDEQFLGLEHIQVAVVFCNLASLYEKQSQYKKAELHFQRAYSILEKQLAHAPWHPYMVNCLYGLIAVYIQQHKYNAAKQLIGHSESLIKRALKSDDIDPEDAAMLKNLLNILNTTPSSKKTEREYRSKNRAKRVRDWLM